MLSEFDIIRTFFNQPGLGATPGEVTRLGIGDDCALLSVPPGKELALSMDTLVEKIHFPENAPPELLAWRALSVNLSDLAAMGATPVGFTLSLAMPEVNESWLQHFSKGLKNCAEKFQCPLLGGDTTKGPLTMTIQVHGLVSSGQALVRSGARAGDSIYVSGSLGLAALAVIQFDEAQDQTLLEEAFYKPAPRLALGSGAAGLASAGIDISDGLLADLGHVCRASSKGAEIQLADIPVSPSLQKSMSTEEALALALTGGDDYELILTVPPSREGEMETLAHSVDTPLICIGKITDAEGITCFDAFGEQRTFQKSGYQHFNP